MQMKRVSVFCFAALISCLLIGCESQPKEPGRYYNKGKGFSIKFPDGWERVKTPPMGIEIQFTNPASTEIISVQVQKISPQKTLTDGFNFMKSLIQNNGGVISSAGQETIDDCDAKWFVTQYNRENILYYLLKKEDYLYAIMLGCSKDTVSDDFENKMREIAKTFRFEK
ncbi:MAG: hypothetical protein HZA17_14770 [Nitrospirae bacterium]|nr:hypothetical protein [Nitrospirota bacterium]